mmetsp:Transcript_33340/g.107096  ORF Transcript_33340/g.107096 Transcript_33340/m.107096 type:complete len:410 (-) Transcript_33340:35-1264(-)
MSKVSRPAYCSPVCGLTPNGSYLFTRATAGAVHPARWRGVCGHHRRLAPAPLPVGEACLASIKEAVGVERRLRPPPRRGLEVGLVGAVDVAVVQPEERVEARGGDLPDHLGPPLAPPEAADGDVDGSVRCRVERKGGAPRVAHLEVGLQALSDAEPLQAVRAQLRVNAAVPRVGLVEEGAVLLPRRQLVALLVERQEGCVEEAALGRDAVVLIRRHQPLRQRREKRTALRLARPIPIRQTDVAVAAVVQVGAAEGLLELEHVDPVPVREALHSVRAVARHRVLHRREVGGWPARPSVDQRETKITGRARAVLVAHHAKPRREDSILLSCCQLMRRLPSDRGERQRPLVPRPDSTFVSTFVVRIFDRRVGAGGRLCIEGRGTLVARAARVAHGRESDARARQEGVLAERP